MSVYVDLLCQNSKKAQKNLLIHKDARRSILRLAVENMQKNTEYILAENEKDICNAKSKGATDAFLDRLRITKERIDSICEGTLAVASMEDPLGKGTLKKLDNGLLCEQITVPMGVVCMVYEARPNVTADAAALCIMAGNSVILRGGSEAICSNIAIAESFRDAAVKCGVSVDIVQVVTQTDRNTVLELMQKNGEIDLMIPRGGKSLIQNVVQNATVPVIETGAGNCHVYVEKTADLNMALNIIDNAKTSRPSVCNAAETLLCDSQIAAAFLPMMQKRLKEKNVELRICEKSACYIDGAKATEVDFQTEFNDYILAVKVVEGIDEAISHIDKYSTGHSEAIVTSSMEAADIFRERVDAAAIYVNASTRFTDGGVYGLGAEIGISTQKLHVRGPFGLSALVTTKYLVTGNGQIR